MPLQHEPDVSQADWFTRRGDPWKQLCSIGPSGSAHYVRLFHPLQPGDDESDPQSLLNVEGSLETMALQRLVTVLARHTTTPGDCLFGLWGGLGDIHGSPSTAVIDGQTQGARARRRPQLTIPPAFPPKVMDGPRVSIPARDYLLFRGQLSQAGQWGAAELRPGDALLLNSPNVMWPADRAWFVATEIDLPWTGIGGSAQLIQDLVADDGLDVERVQPAADLPYWHTVRGATSAP